MEENQIQTQLEASNFQIEEPTSVDNSEIEENEDSNSSSNEIQEEGQSFDTEKDPSEELILGKFKSVEDLAKAYEELQRHQGQNSEELGSLRKELNAFNSLKKDLEQVENFKNTFIEVINRDMLKYNTPDYMQNQDFIDMYTQALTVFQGNLDTDRFIEMLDSYVDSRIKSNDIKKSANAETQNIIDSMTYSKNPKAHFTPPKKRFDEMTAKEIDEMLDKFI